LGCRCHNKQICELGINPSIKLLQRGIMVRKKFENGRLFAGKTYKKLLRSSFSI